MMWKRWWTMPLLLAAGILLPGLTAPDAAAAPSVCASLAKSPTVGTVEQLVFVFVAEGFTGYEAGTIIGLTVQSSCPQFFPVLERFAQAYAPDMRGPLV